MMNKYLKIFTLTLFSFFFNPLFSQNQVPKGPGGVGTTDGTSSLVLWLDANTVNQNDNSEVFSWSDNSGFSNNAVAPFGTGPQFKLDVINGYPQLKFDISNTEYLGVYNSNRNHSLQMDEQLTVFVVGKLTDATNTWGAFVSRTEDNSWSKGYALYRDVNNSNNNLTIGGYVGKWADSRITTAIQTNQNTIMSLHYDYSDKNLSLFKSEDETNRDYTKKIKSKKDETLWLGWARGVGDGHYLDGAIAETIILKRAVNEAERIIIHNYLSAKYNIPLAANDFYKQDNPENGNFDHKVAGIGKAADGSEHKDSQGTGIVRMKNPSNLSNNSFLFWGENVKNNSEYKFPLNTNNSICIERLNTTWRVSKSTNDLGTVRVSFDRNKISLANGAYPTEPLFLIVDNNEDFSSPKEAYALDASGNISEPVKFEDGDYFTLARGLVVWSNGRFKGGSRANGAPGSSGSNKTLLILDKDNSADLNDKASVCQIFVKDGAEFKVSDGVELTVQSKIVNNGTIDLLGEAQLIQKHEGESQNSGSGKLKIRQQGTGNLFNYNYWSAPVNRDRVHEIAEGEEMTKEQKYGSWQIGFLKADENTPINFIPQHTFDADTLPSTVSSRWLYSYNASSDRGYYGWQRLTTSSALTPGVGYIMKGTGIQDPLPIPMPNPLPILVEQEYLFSGEPNNGDYVYEVTSGYDFLIGNPYPSALDADKFIRDNLSVINGEADQSSGVFDGSLYFYEQFHTNNTHVTRDYQGGYATYNLMMGVAATEINSNANSAPETNGGVSSKGEPKRFIAIGQAFYVNIDNTGVLKFKNSQRAFAKERDGNSTFFRNNATVANEESSDSRTKFWLSFTDPSNRVSQIGLGYDDFATVGYDKGYDSADYSGNPDYMLWDIQGGEYVIQGRNNFDLDNEMPLVIKISTSGEYKIGLKETLNFPENTPIFLKDLHSDVYYNLIEGDATVHFEAGTYNDQYAIVYQQESLGIEDHEEVKSVSVMFDENADTLELLGIADLNNLKAASIYSIDGKLVSSYSVFDSEVLSVSTLSDGVYILKLEMKNGASDNIKFVKF